MRVSAFQEHLDAALLEISRHLLCRGSTLLYAGHLGATGYTLRLFDLVLGGKVGPTSTVTADGTRNVSWYSSRIPGVLEEVLLTLQAGKPLYLCGAFGGAAALAVELLQRRVPEEFTWDFHKQAPHAEGMRDLYTRRGLPWLDYPWMAKFFAETGVAELAKNNHLSEDENRELFTSRDVPRILELLLNGLSRI